MLWAMGIFSFGDVEEEEEEDHEKLSPSHNLTPPLSISFNRRIESRNLVQTIRKQISSMSEVSNSGDNTSFRTNASHQQKFQFFCDAVSDHPYLFSHFRLQCDDEDSSIF
jgi:hypothetical protein